MVGRFQEFTGEFPWQWRPVDVEELASDPSYGLTAAHATSTRADANHRRSREHSPTTPNFTLCL